MVVQDRDVQGGLVEDPGQLHVGPLPDVGVDVKVPPHEPEHGEDVQVLPDAIGLREGLGVDQWRPIRIMLEFHTFFACGKICAKNNK